LISEVNERVDEEVEGVGIENDANLRHGVEEGWDVGEESDAGEGAENEGVCGQGRVVVGTGQFEETKLFLCAVLLLHIRMCIPFHLRFYLD